jgi:hypothetical protein
MSLLVPAANLLRTTCQERFEPSLPYCMTKTWIIFGTGWRLESNYELISEKVGFLSYSV